MTTPMPAARARSTASTAVMPQSQVMMSEAPASPGRLESRFAEVVSVSQAVRQEGNHVRLGGTEGAGEQRRGALTVDVVVAVDEDGAAGAHRAGDGLHRVAHPREGVGIGELIQRRPEIAAGHLRLRLAPLHQERGQRLRQVQTIRQRPDGGAVGPSRHDPAEHRGLKDAHHPILLPGLFTKTIPPAPEGTGSRRRPHSTRARRRDGSGSAG